MQPLLTKLRAQFPQLTFTAGPQFYWSPETSEIFYQVDARGQRATWSLLHETGHALLEHKNYSSDMHLLQLEMAAWERARELAASLTIVIDENHIQDCLDTYRDWLYQRSICPSCSTKCLQQDDSREYRCFNCHTAWRVSDNRFARPYRAHKNVPVTTVSSSLPIFNERHSFLGP
ncbi:MAG TPA: hypothetical protein VG992_00715 [Candidatus Saccharimonadales bacterium]|nr:hypothetical protein [Candidatus Saccharimonadales bacterium]